MNGKLIISKGTEIRPEEFYHKRWCGFSTSINEMIIIGVKATGNEYLVRVHNFNGSYSSYTDIIHPPKELLDNVNLLNGSRHDLDDPDDVDYRQLVLKISPDGILMELVGLYRSSAQINTIFNHFKFYQTTQRIEYEQIEVTQTPKDRAVKV